MAEDKKPILCLDFDGVIHAYTSGWKGIDVIPDGPVPGAIEFIVEAQKYFNVAVYSSRSETYIGIDAMKTALWTWIDQDYPGEVGASIYAAIQFPTTKPSAFVSIDDRAVTFVGRWPDPSFLREFQPWNKCTSGEMQRSIAELTRPADLIAWASIPSILNQEERIRLERTLGNFARAVQMTQRIGDHKEAALYLQHASADIVGLVDLVSTRVVYDRITETARLAPAPLPVTDTARQRVFAIVENLQAHGCDIDDAQEATDKIIELLRPSGDIPIPPERPGPGTVGHRHNLTDQEHIELDRMLGKFSLFLESEFEGGKIVPDLERRDWFSFVVGKTVCPRRDIYPGTRIAIRRDAPYRADWYLEVSETRLQERLDKVLVRGCLRAPREMYNILLRERNKTPARSQLVEQSEQAHFQPPGDRLIIEDPHFLTGPEWTSLEELIGDKIFRVNEDRDLVGPIAIDWPPSDEMTVRLPSYICLAGALGLGRVLELTRNSSRGTIRRYLEIRSVTRPPDDQYWELSGPLRAPRAMLEHLKAKRDKYSFEPSPPATAEQQASMLDEPGG